jgi:hypothetical protein
MTDQIRAAEARDLKTDLMGLPGVEAVTVSMSNPNVRERRTVRVTLAEGYFRAPPRLIRCLAERDLGVVDVSRQGTQCVVLAT